MTWTPLAGSTITTTQTVRNGTAALVYPRWEIVGPGYYLILQNVTAGKRYRLNYSIRYGDLVLIDFDPTKKTQVSTYDGDLTSYVLLGSEYWNLGLGDNSIYVELGGMAAASKVTMIRIPQ